MCSIYWLHKWINNTQTDNAKNIDIVMSMYNLIEYSDNYSKTSEVLWKYYRDEPFLDANGAITDFPADDNKSASFTFKTKIADKIENSNTKDIKIVVPLKYFSNFWRNLRMPFINCEINLLLTWSASCFIIDDPVNNQVTTFTIIYTKLYVPVVTLSTQDNAKLLQQLKSGFKRTINWNKYQSKVTEQKQSWYFDYLIDPSFQEVNRLFVLSFENYGGPASYKRCCLLWVEKKDYNVKIDGRKIFNQPVKNNLRTYDNIRKIATNKGDDYMTGCLLDYPNFKNYYKVRVIDLSKEWAPDMIQKQ